MTEAETHYTNTFHPQRRLSRANVRLYNEILNMEIESAFEFGCGIGRNLTSLKSLGITNTSGCDVNWQAIKEAQHNELCVSLGNEYSLTRWANNSFDLVFTSSVLCHIKDPRTAIVEMKRMASKCVLVFECINVDERFFYTHDYELFSFTEVLEQETIKGRIYKLYKWQK